MNKINYLSIAKTPYKISYAIFNGKNLKSYGEIFLNYMNYETEIYNFLTKTIKKESIDVVLSNEINLERYLKKDIIKLSEFRTILKLVSLLEKAVYVEFRTYGWEKRITFNKPTKKQKIDTINFGYDLDLSMAQFDIANAIILGEGVAHNRLQIGSV